MLTSLLLLSPLASADPLDPDDPHAGLEPAPKPEPAPASTPPSSNTPALGALNGTWFAVSTVNGKPVVDWSCKDRPASIEFDDNFVMVAAAGQQNGGAISSSTAKGDALVLTTAISACTGAKQMTLKWTDSGHHTLEVTRCEGTARVLKVVRDRAAGVPVMRQCCDPSGKMITRVDIDSACPKGSDGPKPDPLK